MLKSLPNRFSLGHRAAAAHVAPYRLILSQQLNPIVNFPDKDRY
jgi:hypothetical protein